MSKQTEQIQQEEHEQEQQLAEVLLSENPQLSEVAKKDPQIERLLRENPEFSGTLLKITHSQFSGPLPHPDILRGYDSIVPNAASDILEMTKNDTKHIQEMQKLALKAKAGEVFRGQVFGFLIGAIAILAGTYAATHGAETAGSVIGGTGVATLAAVFVLGRKPKQSDSDSVG